MPHNQNPARVSDSKESEFVLGLRTTNTCFRLSSSATGLIVRLLLGLLFALVVAAVVGLGATWLTLSHGIAFGAVQIGPWTAWPKTGTREVDPYARANIARNGELPIGSGDGVAFIAHTDDHGQPLDGRCDVILSGVTPQARYWTVTLYNPQGLLVGNSISRHGFTSQEIVRRADGSFDVIVAPRARAGNWLPTNGIDSYRLVLRLYDTPVGVTTRAARDAPMPAITVQSCP
jgi:hypothetical protein